MVCCALVIFFKFFFFSFFLSLSLSICLARLWCFDLVRFGLRSVPYLFPTDTDLCLQQDSACLTSSTQAFSVEIRVVMAAKPAVAPAEVPTGATLTERRDRAAIRRYLWTLDSCLAVSVDDKSASLVHYERTTTKGLSLPSHCHASRRTATAATSCGHS
jgi:hypothetical protein